MELTKEYLDEKLSGLSSRMDGLATKKDLEEAIKPLATKADLREGIDELARMVAEGFADTARKQALEDAQSEMQRGFENTLKTLDRIFIQIDKNAEMRVRQEQEILQLRTRVESIEGVLQKLNIQSA